MDLFCGVGGLTHGLARGGIAVVAGVDFDPACRFAYESNNLAKFLHRDVRTLTAEDVSSSFGTAPIRLLAGCAPCQPFSTYSRARRGQRSDEMWDLLVEFGKLIHEVQPELVTMENVPELAQHGVFEAFLRDLGGYSVSYGIVECQRYGIPQTRKRLVLLASRLGSIRLVEPETPSFVATVRSAIGGLGPVGAGESDAIDAMHSACRLSEINLRRIRASQPGGTWRDWGDNLVASCHRKGSGATYPSVYGRMEWDRPSPTVTTQCFGYGNGRFGHPEQDRAITLREAAILQTFPPEYRFLPEGERPKFYLMGRLIGNAVPVRLGEMIAKSFRQHVEVARVA